MQTINGVLDKLIGEGASSWVYSVKDSNHAIKISKDSSHSMAEQYYILKALSKTHPSLFPNIVQKEQFILRQRLQDGLCQEKFSQQCLVMQRLGISLEQFINFRGNINLPTLIRIGQQLLSQIQALIAYGISHNDIKPSNIMFGMGQKRSKVYLIDYGFASIKNDKNNMQSNTFRGNLSFASTYRLKTNISDPKNDLQSFIYLMVWVLNDGNLPWQQISEGSFSRKIQQIIKGRMNFVQMTMEVTRDSFSKRDILIHQLVLILSLLQSNESIISSNDLLLKLKTLF